MYFALNINIGSIEIILLNNKIKLLEKYINNSKCQC